MSNSHVVAGGHEATAQPIIREIGFKDVEEALAKGVADFWAMPSHAVFLSILYPIVGVFLVYLTSGQDVMPLLFPILSGFALIGPFAAIGLYEVSRRRELGLETTWQHAFDVLRSPAIPSIAVLGLILTVIFISWLGSAEALYRILFRPTAPHAYLDFLKEVFTTQHGFMLIIIGNTVGFLYTVLVFSISVVSFPLLLDKNVGVATAIQTSVRSVLANPLPMAFWALIVAVVLALGTLALLVGLAIALPVLGHATWHLYRRVIAFDDVRRPGQR